MENTKLRENNLFCLGSPLIDVISEVDEDFLKQYDLPVNGAVVETERLRNMLQKLENVRCQPGGSVTNTARVSQWILKLPRSVTYVGTLGIDSFAQNLKNCLSKEGVNGIFVEKEDVTTGKCVVLVQGPNRTLCTNLGASKYFDIEHLLIPDIKKRLDEAKFIYLSAFFLAVSHEVCQNIAKMCLAENKTFIINLGAPFLCQKYREEMKELVSFANVVFGNQAEASALAGICQIDENDILNVCAKINNLQPQVHNKNRSTVITRGSFSIFLAENGAVQEYEVEKIERENLKDTNGAGDAFVGGFLAKYVQNYPTDCCVKCGIWAAREIIRNVGCKFDSSLSYSE